MSEDCNRTKAQQLFEEAWKLKLPASQKQVLMTMVDAADENGIYGKGIQYIALDTEFCDAQVRRIIAELVSDGFIKIETAPTGRKSATYSFDLAGRLNKMSIRNVETNVLTTALIKHNVETNVRDDILHKQNVQSNIPDGGVLIEQNVEATHSHNILSTQKVEPNGASSNAREDSQHTTNLIPITGRLLIESWIVAHPENKKPQHTYTQENITLANKLAADGFTVEEVSQLTAEKWQNRSRKYEFRFLDEDLRARRQIHKPPPNSAAPPQNGKHDQPPADWPKGWSWDSPLRRAEYDRMKAGQKASGA